MTFSEHLLQLRTARDLTQKSLAAKIGISWRTYQNYELGLREPPLSTLIALADFYDLPLDELIKMGYSRRRLAVIRRYCRGEIVELV